MCVRMHVRVCSMCVCARACVRHAKGQSPVVQNVKLTCQILHNSIADHVYHVVAMGDEEDTRRQKFADSYTYVTVMYVLGQCLHIYTFHVCYVCVTVLCTHNIHIHVPCMLRILICHRTEHTMQQFMFHQRERWCVGATDEGQV